MLTAKQNMIECMKGSKGNPDRYVNQYEAVNCCFILLCLKVLYFRKVWKM